MTQISVKEKSMGIVLKRRDNAPIVKRYLWWCDRYFDEG